MPVGRLLVIIIIIGASVTGLYQYFSSDPEPVTSVQEVTAPTEESPEFSITAIQVAPNHRQILNCNQGKCEALPPVSGEVADAITDGQYWYYYQEEGNRKSLLRTPIGGSEAITIIEQTPLVSPRGLYISPDNRKMAYWLDNVDQPSKKLTELWYYDADAGGTQLLAEKLNQSALLSILRWNRSSSHAWVIGDTSEPSEDPKIELLLVSTNPPSIRSAFPEINWEELQEIANKGVIDISSDGRSVAYVTKRFGFTKLNIHAADKEPDTATQRGDIVYLQWREGGELLYVIQDPKGFSFWQTSGTIHKQVARRPGKIESLRGDAIGKYFVFAARETDHSRAYGLNADTGSVTDQGALPVFSNHTYLVQFEIIEEQPVIAGITSELEDEEVIAFIQKHVSDISNSSLPRPQRIVVTEKANTVLFDYLDDSSQSHRVLVTVRDAIHSEWSISARYQEMRGEWVKTEGGGASEPTPVRLYEWEADLGQWVLKEDYQAK